MYIIYKIKMVYIVFLLQADNLDGLSFDDMSKLELDPDVGLIQ